MAALPLTEADKKAMIEITVQRPQRTEARAEFRLSRGQCPNTNTGGWRRSYSASAVAQASPIRTIASETSELAGMSTAASSGFIFPARERTMATAL